MKKKIFIPIITIFIIIVIILGTYNISKYLENKKYNDILSKNILENNWSREGTGDTEHIYFGANGEFGYYCSCGNGVDGYDMCDTYKYDKETKTIKLDCLLPSIEDEIKIVKSNEYELVLKIKGEERTFKSEQYHLLENPLPFAGTKFISKDERYNLIFNKDGNYEAYDSKKQEFSLYSGNCWTWTHQENSKEIILECNDETTEKIEIKEYNETELKLYFSSEKQTITFYKK